MQLHILSDDRLDRCPRLEMGNPTIPSYLGSAIGSLLGFTLFLGERLGLVQERQEVIHALPQLHEEVGDVTRWANCIGQRHNLGVANEPCHALRSFPSGSITIETDGDLADICEGFCPLRFEDAGALPVHPSLARLITASEIDR